MAFQKAIENPKTGVTANYWRVTVISIAPTDMSARIQIGGYTSANIRQNNGVPVDQRAYDLGPQQFAPLAQSPTNGPTMFDAIGGGCYEYIRNARRQADNYDPQTGIATCQGVEYSGADVVNVGTVEQPLYTVPSEFADAVDV